MHMRVHDNIWNLQLVIKCTSILYQNHGILISSGESMKNGKTLSKVAQMWSQIIYTSEEASIRIYEHHTGTDVLVQLQHLQKSDLHRTVWACRVCVEPLTKAQIDSCRTTVG